MSQPIGPNPATSTPEIHPVFRPGAGALDAPTLELPVIAASAGLLATSIADDRVTDEEIEGSAETVADFLRSLVEKPIPDCPDWCVINHADRARHERTEGVRECSTSAEPIPTLSGGTIDAAVVRFTDLLTGRVREPEVRVGDDTITPENALRLSDAVLTAAAVANTNSVREVVDAVDAAVQWARVADAVNAAPGSGRPGCAPWCAWPGDTNCGGECMADPVSVPATAGYWQQHEQGMRCARVEAYAVVTEDGAPSVHVTIDGPVGKFDDRTAWAVMTPAEARRHAYAVLAQVELAEQVQR